MACLHDVVVRGQVLDWDNAAYQQLNPGYKLVNMYFQVPTTAAAAAGCAQLLKAHRTDNPTTRPPRQTIAIRTSGFNSVDLTKLSSSILWLYTGMTMKRDPYTRHTRHTHTRATHTVSSPYQTSIRNDVHRRIARCHHRALHRQDQR